MSITDKTRKTLWARSGNRCAMCRKELVAEKNELDKNLNLGDECHIISSKPKGPRHREDYTNYDAYGNLILLCKNDHWTIDEFPETYTEELLRAIKVNHENWVSSTLENANNNNQESLETLWRLTTGKQIVDVIYSAHLFWFDHDEFQTEEEADHISAFLERLQDWGDLSGMIDIEFGEKARYGFSLNSEIETLDKMGFYVFGKRKTTNVSNYKNTNLGKADVAIIFILRKNNPGIIDLEKAAMELSKIKP